MAVTNGIEIEIVVRKRANGRPVGKSGHSFVAIEEESASPADRQRIATEAARRVEEFMKSRLVIK